MSLSEQESSKNFKAFKPQPNMTESNQTPIVEDALNEPSFAHENPLHDSHEGNPCENHQPHCDHHHMEPHIGDALEKEEDPQKHKDSRHRHQFDGFMNELEKLPNAETKLQHTILFMEASISQSGTPHFKSFWEARNICLQLFKENIPPSTRVLLWSKYNELSKEARRLKEILDEQSAFAVEQIEIAVKALEDDIAHFNEHLEKMPDVNFTIDCQSLDEHMPEYRHLQRELNLLNTQASRINALRKELIRTEMRVRQKNKFFQRLSATGDKVFPRRKELIKIVSQRFMTDVDEFIQANFSKDDIQDSLFFLREEIKAFQNIAKILTLNTHSFTYTRMKLSECWDQVKHFEKERKKERAQQKAIYRDNFEMAMKRIHEFSQAYAQGSISTNEGIAKLDEIYHYMRGLQLGKEEFHLLREELNAARRPVKDKINQEEQDRHSQSQEREKQRRHKIQEIGQDIEALLKNAESFDSEKLTAERDTILEKIGQVAMNKVEKQEFERQLKPLRDLISEKKETNLMALSDDDRESLQQYREILQQRLERKQEIKTQIETLRKASGSSGLDFEQAMSHNTQMAVEKERLEKINQGIKEIQQKITNFEKK